MSQLSKRISSIIGTGAALMLLGLAGPADARRIAIDLGAGRFEDTGFVWEQFSADNVINLEDDANGGYSVGVPFLLNYGQDITPPNSTTLFISQNGAVTLGQPLPDGFGSISKLTDLGVPVISPGYADYKPSALGPDEDFLGLQGVSAVSANRDYTPGLDGKYGPLDPEDDFACNTEAAPDVACDQALRIMWYGLQVDDVPYFLQIELFNLAGFDGFNPGDFELRLNVGSVDFESLLPPDAVGGFVLGDHVVELSANDFTNDDPNAFIYRFVGGRLVGDDTTPVPEPDVLALLGFALGALALRCRRAPNVNV